MRLPFGLNLPDSQQLMREMEKMSNAMKDVSASGAAGGDMVVVTLDGKSNVSVRISDEAYSIGGKEVLETLVAAAVHDAIVKLEEAVKEKNSEAVAKLMGQLS